ncbi:MAG TPA: PP2C family serine/threonine-protein phosphatase [Zeimonas sp.]|nr:PP2C family serine/threonine-protein phosphatase [Zeimonas sp.]
MRFSIYQDTLCGARTTNQDRMGYCFTRESLLMLVADGMGGHLHGEVAAHLALQAAAACFQADARPLLDDPPAFLDRALRHAHHEILRYQALHDLPEAPRTTIVACVVQQGRAWWAHAGDSRLYWVRDARLVARTRDHSKVQNLIDLGQIDEAEAEAHPERNKVLNCLGSPFEPTVDLGGDVVLRPGDTLMLCTDGVWSALTEPVLVEHLSAEPVLAAVPRLVRTAVDRAGAMADNATALAMTWDDLASAGATLSSDDVPDGAITTTIAVGQLDAGSPADVLSEDEIERTIREIREAISRTGSS